MDSHFSALADFDALPGGMFGVSRKAARRLVERLAAQCADLEARLKDANARIAEFEAKDATIRDSIVAAQRAAELTREEARQEASRIVDHAKSDAAKVESAAQQRLNDLRWELERVQQERKRLVANYRAQVEESLRVVDTQADIIVPEGPAVV